MSNKESKFLKLKNVTIESSVKKSFYKTKLLKHRLLNKIDLQIKKNNTFAVVGESGSGKSILAKTIFKLLLPSSGKIFFKNEDITSIKNNKLKFYRKEVRLITNEEFPEFENNLKLEDLFNYYKKSIFDNKISQNKFLEYIECSKKILKKFVYEVIKKDQEKIKIGRMLLLNPQVVVFDDFANNLNTTETLEIQNLLLSLKKEFNLTYILTSKNINIFENFVDELAILYLGNIVEKGPSSTLLKNPKHPYTKNLLSTFLSTKKSTNNYQFSGCHYYSHCGNATNLCEKKTPKVTYESENHLFKCFNPL